MGQVLDMQPFIHDTDVMIVVTTTTPIIIIIIIYRFYKPTV